MNGFIKKNSVNVKFECLFAPSELQTLVLLLLKALKLLQVI